MPDLIKNFDDLLKEYGDLWEAFDGTITPLDFLDRSPCLPQHPSGAGNMVSVSLVPFYGVYIVWETHRSGCPSYIGSVGILRRTKTGIKITRSLFDYGNWMRYVGRPATFIAVPSNISPKALAKILLQGCVNQFRNLPLFTHQF